ncbi:MAG: hypothetical protein V1914_00125 [archaeon]
MLLPINFPGFEGQNTKSKVVSLLSQKYPLTKMKVYRELKSNGLSLGFHAINKAVNELEESEVLSKSDRQYKLNYEWVSRLHNFVDGLQSKLLDEKGCLIHGVKDLKQEGNITTLTFDNLLDMDHYSKGVHDYYYSKLSEKDIVCLVFDHHWWHILYPEKEYNDSVLNKRFYCICTKNTLLDTTGSDFKKALGMNVLHSSKMSSTNFAVYGDVVIQNFVGKDIVDGLDKFFVNTKSLKDIAAPQKFVNKVLKKEGKVIVLINKNAELAAQLRSKVLDCFKK